ncbi:MAG: xanthine dehydrogenase family protein subunit M [Thermoleophilia bacterium]|nr:xanthine dehydrogenase family protein subunit M [Thermoleophilia bacterium]
MIPAPFEYERATSVEDALALLARYGEEAKLLAGGHSLLPLMKLRFARPSVLVDLGGVDELRYVRDDGERVAVGALVTHEEVHRDPILAEACPLLAHAAGEVGDPQVRHMGTIGGSVAHADPAGDLPTVLVTLEADVVVRGMEGVRTTPAVEFFRGTFDPALAQDEIVTEIRAPKTGAGGWSYVKFHPRAQDWAIVGVAALVQRTNGAAARTAVGLTNMGSTPLRARAVEDALAGGADPGGAAEAASEGTSPVDDAFASAEYRRYLAPVLVRRALEEALAR